MSRLSEKVSDLLSAFEDSAYPELMAGVIVLGGYAAAFAYEVMKEPDLASLNSPQPQIEQSICGNESSAPKHPCFKK